MNKKTLVTLVRKEAAKLKKKALKGEINRLDFSSLYPEHSDSCIYGQMTGDCFGPRANTLIASCSSKVYEQRGQEDLPLCKLNGKPKLGGVYSESERSSDWFSPIECFIWFSKNRKNGNNKILIDYLKGERKTLRFKKF